MPTSSVTVRTLDGLHLAGTLVMPPEPPDGAVVLVHGGGVTREEGGFFGRLADGLASAGLASVRFDLRAHGESEGRQEELTLAAVLNDIRVMLAFARARVDTPNVTLLGASFGGGICAESLGDVQAPTLIVHGDADTLVPVESSRAAVRHFNAPCALVEVPGSQHGFAVHDDPQYLNPKSQEYQASVIRTVTDWLTA